MRIRTSIVWVWAILLVVCVTSNLSAEKIITSPDWADPLVAGELVVMFTEEAIDLIMHALDQGVENGELTVVRYPQYTWFRTFVLSDPEECPWVTGIASMDSLNRIYGLKLIEPVFHSDPSYGRRDRVFRLKFAEDTDILHLMNLYAELKEVEYAEPNGIAEVTVIQASTWGRIKARYLEKSEVK